jgi:hypothetical protein
MKTTRIFVCIALFALLSCHNSDKSKSVENIDALNQPAKFDTTLIRVFDYTGDGVLDTATLQITGKSFNSPLSWTYVLRSNGQTVYHQEGYDDSTSNTFYADPRYVGNCKDYADCKKKYYFQELGLSIVDSSGYGDGIADHMKDKNWGALAYHYIMDSCGVTNKSVAEAIVDSMASVIKFTKPKLVSFLESPVQDGSLMMFVKRFNRFVPVYHE